MTKTSSTVIDLFAGAGLFSYAFREEGFVLGRAIEADPVAAATYARNLGDIVCVADVRKIEPDGDCSVLIAGPPCQGFSTLGKQDEYDPRSSLSLQVVRWARELKPRIVVIENVEAFLRAPTWEAVKTAFQGLGYDVHACTVDAYEMGAPQLRVRSFMFASRIGQPVAEMAVTDGNRTVREAWRGLPPKPDGINNHYAPEPSRLALARMRLIPEGGDKRDILQTAPELAPPSWKRTRSEATDVWGRMRWDSPSNTLRTTFQNPSKGRYIHPEQNRVISLREAARLHTIPDLWGFEGLPTQVSRQIGNSVPPALGRAVARGVKRLIAQSA